MRYWFYSLEIGYLETLDKLNDNWHVSNFCITTSFWSIFLFHFNEISTKKSHASYWTIFSAHFLNLSLKMRHKIYIEFTMRHWIYSCSDWYLETLGKLNNHWYINNLCIITSFWPKISFLFQLNPGKQIHTQSQQ